MNVILVAMGSHGDVHPFVGIGIAMRERGHRVRVIANAHFESLVSGAGLGFVEVGTAEEYRQLATDPMLWKKLRGTRTVLTSVGRTLRPVYEAIARANVPGETVVAASTLGLGTRVAAEHLKIPTATVHLQPSIFLSAAKPPALQGLFMPAWMPMWMRHAQLSLVNSLSDRWLAPSLNAFRQELGLGPVRRILSDYMHSPQRIIGLFPEWYAPPQPDWPPQVRLTGFPLYDERGTATLAPDLSRFLDAGAPPIAFTPGSAMWTGHRFFEESARACQILGRRGLLLSRHLEHVPRALPPCVRHVTYAPFSELLPRCAALVHHGGIGTSAQALAAATPQIVTPHAHDQPDNAARLTRLGVARELSPKRYVARPVAAVLDELLGSSVVRERCREMATRFVGIDPIRETCDLLEALLPERSANGR